MDTHTMINLIALLQPSEDRDGVFNGRLINLHRLETTLKSGILLDVFAVLIQGGSADAVQLASCQHRLEEVTGIHAALGFPRADDVVQLIDEKDDTAFTLADFIQHCLEPFLKFAAVLCSGNQRSHVQGMKVDEREVLLSEVPAFKECGLCGTAAVISPVGKIFDHGKEISFASGMEKMGPVMQKLYDTLTGIQMGRLEAPEGWICTIM